MIPSTLLPLQRHTYVCFILQQFKVQGIGEQCVRAEVLVPTDNSNLNLWYPNGYGKPNLYPFDATININKVRLLYICL